MAYTTNINDSSPTTYYTTYTNSPSGVLLSAYVGDYRPRTVTYTNDMSGQVIRRDEADNYATIGDPHQIWYRFNGREMATTGNMQDFTKTSYAYTIAERTKKPVPATPHSFYAQGVPDGDLSFDAVTSFRQGAGGGRYNVRSGDTLQSIAQQAWGDSSLWYKIAEANGLSAEATLIDGQTLTLPSGVTRMHNNAGTFKPYDGAEAIGNTAPTTPKPPKKPKGGLFGKILLAVIQIVVTIVLTAALTPLLGPAAPVVAAMGANAVSQGVGVATGIQDKFSWKQVAITGITAAVTMGIDTTGAFGWIANATVRAGVTGAASSAISQGIGVATGLQPKFDWVGVAAAGVGAMAGHAIGGAAAKQFGLNGSNPLDGAIYRGIRTGASLIANAATRSVAQGTSFGDNIIAALPDAIASTIGGFLQAGIAGRPASKAAPGSSGLSEEPIHVLNSGPIGMGSVDVSGIMMSDQAVDAALAGSADDIVVTGFRTAEARLRNYAMEREAYYSSYTDAPAEAASVDRRRVYLSGPDKGEPVSLAEPVRWIDPYHKEGFFGRYAVRGDGEQIWQDFVSEDAWERAQLSRTFDSAKTSAIQLGSDVGGGLYDLAAGAVGLVQMAIDIEAAPYSSAAARRTNVRIEGIQHAIDNPIVIGRAFAEPYRQFLEEGRVRGITTSVASTALPIGRGPRFGSGGLSVAGGGAARTNFAAYEVLSQQRITGASRSVHRVSANRGLYKDLQTNPQLAAYFNSELGVDVVAHMMSGRGRDLLNPLGTVWHHPANDASVMQLLRINEHANPRLQPILHPGPNRTGGFGVNFGGN